MAGLRQCLAFIAFAGLASVCGVSAGHAQATGSPAPGQAVERGNPHGEWRYWGADAWSTRYSPLDQINASNFGNLEVAWIWRGDNFGPNPDNILRATATYVDGILYTVAGTRRSVIAMDPATGETLWTFREPHTTRWERSMRQNYGKGVSYDEVDGRGRIYVVTPAFFLHALDAKTGRPIESFGDGGTVDMLADLGYPYDPEFGITDSLSIITNSSPPMIVNGVIVVGNSHEQGYYQTRRENAAGHILAYDVRTGRHLWKFNVVPQPGEFGHETWENDVWQVIGNVSSWAPMSADLERGIVYIPTDPPTNDYFGGHRPGDGLFGTSVIALDARTGQRVWHFQTVKHDIWNYDNPVAPILLNTRMNGQETPIVVQTTKQGFAYTFNRQDGRPIWPIEERPVPASKVPGERASPVQPFPTRPAAFEMQGLTHDDLVDYTPELRQRAIEHVSQYEIGPLFLPPLHRDNDLGKRAAVHCPGANGGNNIPGGTVADPETGIIYVASIKACSAPILLPGTERDPDSNMDFVTTGPGGVGGIDGLPLFKPPYGRITAIDMNTGEHLWWIPNGDTPDNVKNHPALQGVDIPVTGKATHATALVTRSLLMYGEGRGGAPLLHAVDKRTGETIASVELPAPTNTAPMTYLHEGRQYIVLAVGSGQHPGSLVALRLP
ncbi:MAG TPA: PQQ-binding-like beta-propeller repeat protein [Longimicrobiales bacterium]|nr:PQQ-binding-like beta-propeller repeat protein [Longimicrobiales bacterium]